MKKRKICAFLTAIAVSSVVFTGCGDKQVEEPKSQTESVQTDKEEESTVKAPEKDVEMKYISEADAEKEVNDDDYLFIDLRKHADYVEGHIPGAVSADVDAAVQGDFKAGYDTLKNTIDAIDEDMDKEVVLICYSGKRYAQNGTNMLSVMGYDMDDVYTLEGGMKAWKGDLQKGEEKAEKKEVKAPEKDVEMKYISPEDAKEEVGDDDYIFLDLRKNKDYEKDHIEGALPADIDAAVQGDFKAGYDKIESLVGKEKKNIVLICYSGKKYAQNGTNILSAMGYDMDKVFTLEGGMKAWK